jgi:DNA-binding response OmpR family regulator
MNGLQLTESIRKAVKNYRLPVIILSDTSNDEMRTQYLKFGVSEILDKPISKKILVEKIKMVFN